MINLLFLLFALLFGAIILIIGYFDNRKKGYNMPFEEECQREEMGLGRYGCRCPKCIEGSYTEAEYKGEDR